MVCISFVMLVFSHLHVVDIVSADNGVVRAAVEENSCRGGATIPDLVVLDAYVVAPLR